MQSLPNRRPHRGRVPGGSGIERDVIAAWSTAWHTVGQGVDRSVDSGQRTFATRALSIAAGYGRIPTLAVASALTNLARLYLLAQDRCGG
jgi:hypothetical protein